MIPILIKTKGSQFINFLIKTKLEILKALILLIAVLYLYYCAIYHVYDILRINISKIRSLLQFLKLVLKLVFMGSKVHGRRFFENHVFQPQKG